MSDRNPLREAAIIAIGALERIHHATVNDRIDAADALRDALALTSAPAEKGVWIPAPTNRAQASLLLKVASVYAGHIRETIERTFPNLDEVSAPPQTPQAAGPANLSELRGAFHPLNRQQEWTKEHSLTYPTKAAEIINAARALIVAPQAAGAIDAREQEVLKPFGWADEKGSFHHSPRQAILGIHGDHDGSDDVSWSGFTLDEAVKAWKELSKKSPSEQYALVGFNCGVLASHYEMQKRYGEPKGTFACPICGKKTPHEHSGREIAIHRESMAEIQQFEEVEWAKVVARVSDLESRYPWRRPLVFADALASPQEAPPAADAAQAVAICGENSTPIDSDLVGCGKPIEKQEDVYRCTDCAVPFHRTCAAKHFKIDTPEHAAAVFKEQLRRLEEPKAAHRKEGE